MRSDPSRPAPRPRAGGGPESFGKDRRILRRAEYLETYATGRRYVGRWLVLFAREGGGERARLGVTVTRKSGGAVVRNRLRRRLRELFRRTAPFSSAIDVVVNVRPGAEAAPFAEIAADFAQLTRKAGAGGGA